MSKGQADLAILPSNLDDSLNWPVIAILRQNVMALIVPRAAAPLTTGATTAASASRRKRKSAKGGKSAKVPRLPKAAKAPRVRKSAKSDDSDDSDDSDSSDDSGDSNKFGKVAQLSGKRVGIVTGNEATAGLLELVLSHYGVPLAKVTVSQIDPNNLADAIKNNQVDVLFVAGAATGPAISSAVAAATAERRGADLHRDRSGRRHRQAQSGLQFRSISTPARSAAIRRRPTTASRVSASANIWWRGKSYSDSVIATLAKVVYSSRQALAAALPGEIKIAAPSTDKDADVVVHPGALAYLSDSQQSFFDKYGDDIFYGMLIFPVFGSAIAGVASYLRSDTPHAAAAAVCSACSIWCARRIAAPDAWRRSNSSRSRPTIS